jgi:geranylgeranyl reductase family protein
MTDVLIVGAGPAGATAARRLAQSGARVRILDRARFPRNKPCGGAISVRALGRFPYLESALAGIGSHRLSRLQLESPGGISVEIASSGPSALTIRRVEFDDLLVRMAVAAGAELVEGVEITQASERDHGVDLTARGGRVFHAPQVIASDGVYSVVARRLGLNPGWPARAIALDLMEETPNDTLSTVDPEALWVSYGYGGSEGYAYVFPKREHVNVGIGYVLDYYRTRVGRAPYQLHQAFVDALRRRGLLAGQSSPEHFTPYQLPVGGPLARTASRRVLLAGDAGGFVNGITAEGIYYAMVTGDLAAQALAGGGPATYETLWRSEIGCELDDAVLVQRELLTSPARIDRVVAGAESMPRLVDGLLQYVQGRVPYRTARRDVLWSLPLSCARLAWRHVIDTAGWSNTLGNLAGSGSRSMKRRQRISQ